MTKYKKPVKTEINVSSVTRELLGLVMKMPLNEKCKLMGELKAPIRKITEDDVHASSVTKILIETIMGMSLDERCQILGELKALTGSSKRNYSRREYSAHVQCMISGNLIKGDIRNISKGGVFVDLAPMARRSFYVDDPVTLIFEHPDTGRNIKVTGIIVRINQKGFAVRLDELL